MKPRQIAIAQINPTVGALAANAEALVQAYVEASAKHATMLVCPELVLVGYPPEDLVLSPSFAKQATQAARDLAAKTSEMVLVFGTVWYESGVVYNAAVVAQGGRIQHISFKNMLPNYGVFDEKRIFAPGHGVKAFDLNGQRIAVLICEDVWFLENAQALSQQHVEKIIVINASPYEMGKLAQRKHIVAQFAQAARAPITYVNMVGGQDDIVFDGASFAVDASGYVTYQAPAFEEGVYVIQPPKDTPLVAPTDGMGVEESIWQAMMMGLRDYVRKNGFKGVVLGISGGIDSAVSATCAVDALGAANVLGVLLPSPYTSPDSNEDAQALAKNLGIQTQTIAITPAMQTMQQTLSAQMGATNWMEDPSTGGNLQARIRGQILMAVSNKTGLMLLSTGNKSEIAVGYSTLYGDSCGGYNVLKDVYKTQVYALANWRNGKGAVIPERSITKAPSAELKPGQKDEDQLPPYALLDAILEQHIEGRKSAEEIAAAGYDKAVAERVVAMVRGSEYKRRQSAPGVKISSMMFGRDRRFPLTNKA